MHIHLFAKLTVVTLLCLAHIAFAAEPAPPARPQVQVEVKKVALAELAMATDDAIQGKPFVLESGGYFFWRGQFNPLPLGLTDAREPNTPTEDLMVAPKGDAVFRWDLGSLPSEGRQLRQIRLWWANSDPPRNGVNVAFAVHDAVENTWREITETLRFDTSHTEPGTYKVLTATFPEKSVVGFDSVRLIDRRPSVKLNTTRFIELDVLTAPVLPVPEVKIEQVELAGLRMATDDAIQGKPFVLEPQSCVIWRGQTNLLPLGLTDARAADTPTEDTAIATGAAPRSFRWDLGHVPPAGRVLKALRLTWAINDPARSGLNVRFEVHDVAAQTWKPVAGWFKEPRVQAKMNTFKTLDVRFPDESIQGFDAVRLAELEGSSRFVELDVFTAPASQAQPAVPETKP